MDIRKRHIKDLTLDLTADIVGSLLFAIGIVCFTGPANIAPGGVSGIAIILNDVWSWLPIGATSLAINIPLLFLSFKYLGRRASRRTICSLIISSFMIDWRRRCYFRCTPVTSCCWALCLAACLWCRISFIFLRGSTTGGTEIVSNLRRAENGLIFPWAGPAVCGLCCNRIIHDCF